MNKVENGDQNKSVTDKRSDDNNTEKDYLNKDVTQNKKDNHTDNKIEKYLDERVKLWIT